MSKVKVDFGKTIGKMKPMHAVNNGPSGSKVRECMYNHDYFEEAGIPYARNHDASFYSGYGGEATVDVHRIFTNFDADVDDPASYDFEWTDKYIADTESVGTKTFYRLGAAIEHQRKLGTYPPKDFLKWAKICEHIIMHYTEGWADGFHYDIEYWEIWNEPDCRAGATGPSSTWQGTDEEFCEFFAVTFKYLKGRFPHLKIGGPAIAWIWSPWMLEDIIKTIRDEKLELDFFSFHRYTRTPQEFLPDIEEAYRLMESCGLQDKTELILNEWNYVKGWRGDAFEYSVKSIKNHKGAAFTAGVMAICQPTPLYMLMYYDARPCAFNGMFDSFNKPLKGYYPFKMFNELYKMKNSTFVESDDKDVIVVAASDGKKSGSMIVYYTDEEDTALSKEVKLDLQGGADKYEFYLIDEDHTNDLIGEIKKDTTITLKPNSVAFLISK